MRASYYAYTMVLFSTALLEIVSRAALGGSDHRSGGANALTQGWEVVSEKRTLPIELAMVLLEWLMFCLQSQAVCLIGGANLINEPTTVGIMVAKGGCFPI